MNIKINLQWFLKKLSDWMNYWEIKMKKLRDYMVTKQALKEELANFKGKSGN